MSLAVYFEYHTSYTWNVYRIGRDDLLGAVVRAGMVDGEPITDRRVVRPGDRGFLAAMLASGHRALSVPVNAASGISGLISPGDRVDVILSHTIKEDGAGPNQRKASETMLSDIWVLALDQRTDDVDGERVVAETATLEVAPKEAEKLSLAQKLGALSLSLRPIARAGDPKEPARPTFTTDREISRVMSATLTRPARAAVLALPLALALALLTAGPAGAAEIVDTGETSVQLNRDQGVLVRLERPVDSVFVADPEIADVQVKSPRLVYVFGKQPGETTMFAVDSNDQVVMSERLVVQHNLASLERALADLA